MPFQFQNPGVLADETLQLHLFLTETLDDAFWTTPIPIYRFEIQDRSSGARVGHINLRIGDVKLLTHFTGNIGYSVDEPHRGHHHAERACRLLLPFAAANGLRPIWITCGPDNLASRRTLERLGAELVEIVDVPADYPLPDGAVRQKCRYRIEGNPNDQGSKSQSNPKPQ
jgi:tagatose 1,6-diphosphate aldolase